MSSCRGTVWKKVASHTLIFTNGGIKRRKSSSRQIPLGSTMTIRTQIMAFQQFSLQISHTSSRKAEGFFLLPFCLINHHKEPEDFRRPDPKTGEAGIRVKKKMTMIMRARKQPMTETRSTKPNLLRALTSGRTLDRLPKEGG
jgi:hypothetical protein